MPARMRALLAVSLLGLLSVSAVIAADATPASTVSAFYSRHVVLHLSGAPTPKQLQMVAPYLSQHLQALLERAWQRRQHDVAKAPDEKPAFAEGDLFSSLFEGPTSFQIAGTQTLAHEYAVTVDFIHQSDGKQTLWRDTVRVAIQQGKPVIVDIEYGGDWEFAAKGTLLTTLEDALLEPSPAL